MKVLTILLVIFFATALALSQQTQIESSDEDIVEQL
jgi:hypothetical protein